MVGDDVEEFAIRRLLGQGPERAGLVVPARRPVPVHDAVEPQRRFLGQHVAVPEEVHADDRRRIGFVGLAAVETRALVLRQRRAAIRQARRVDQIGELADIAPRLGLGELPDLPHPPPERIIAIAPGLPLRRDAADEAVEGVPFIAPDLHPEAVALDPALDHAAAFVMGEGQPLAARAARGLHQSAGARLPGDEPANVFAQPGDRLRAEGSSARHIAGGVIGELLDERVAETRLAHLPVLVISIGGLAPQLVGNRERRGRLVPAIAALDLRAGATITIWRRKLTNALFSSPQF
jgi:hypothetical protein